MKTYICSYAANDDPDQLVQDIELAFGEGTAIWGDIDGFTYEVSVFCVLDLDALDDFMSAYTVDVWEDDC
jgi:hypothetical protein